MFWPYNTCMSDKIYTKYDMDKALEAAELAAGEACTEAYEEGPAAGRSEHTTSNVGDAQNGIMPLRGENLTDCALFILAKLGNRKPCMGEVVAVEAKLQEAGL